MMKPCYAIQRVRAIADVCELEMGQYVGSYLITRINVPKVSRGLGYARLLLGLIIADADAEGATLVLEPLATGGLTQGQLIAWYERHGFVWMGDGEGVMIRKPVRA